MCRHLIAGCFLVGLILPATLPAKSPPELVAARLDRVLAEDLGHTPGELAPTCNDATFVRRAYLDIVGDIPTPEHVTAFLLDPDDNKREKLVRRLLAQPQYGQNWA
ncbi:MAG: DUF1549 domain-containing protein, partial [Planctomycetales bacterium]|nr:DUF1549 domain-containing protein [Planctomycetales bacterium]